MEKTPDLTSREDRYVIGLRRALGALEELEHSLALAYGALDQKNGFQRRRVLAGSLDRLIVERGILGRMLESRAMAEQMATLMHGSADDEPNDG